MRHLFGIVALFAFSTANAGVIYDFTGVVTAANSSNNDLSGVTSGNSISGWFEYDIDHMTPVLGGSIYAFGVPDYCLEIGPRSFSPRTASTVQYEPAKQLFTDIEPVPDNEDLFWTDETYWSFTGLSGAPPDLDSFDTAQIFLRLMTRGEGAVNFIGQVEIYGDITTWTRRQDVPEPSSAWLLGIGLVGIGTLGLRRQRRPRDL
jgi:hypothetical protein